MAETTQRRWTVRRLWLDTDAVPEGSMFGHPGEVSEAFEIPDGASIVAVKWTKDSDVEVTLLVPDET